MRGLRPVGQRAYALVRVNADALKNLILRAPIDVIEIRDAVDLCAGIGFLANIVFAQRDEVLRLVERERPPQHRVQHTKDGSVRPNPECESENNDCGKARLLGEDAKRVTKILHGEITRYARRQLDRRALLAALEHSRQSTRRLKVSARP